VSAHEHDEPDDLTMLLTYEGAVDDDGAMMEAGRELYVMPFWTPRMCAAVIRAAELIGFEPNPDDPVPGHEVSLAAISPALYRAVQTDVRMRGWPARRGGSGALSTVLRDAPAALLRTRAGGLDQPETTPSALILRRPEGPSRRMLQLVPEPHRPSFETRLRRSSG